MPRSYRFEHFQVPVSEPGSRSLRRQDKQRLAESHHAQTDQAAGLRYGKSHAQTEEILKARAMAPPRPGESTPRINRNTTPIGALPTTAELPPRGRFQDLIDEAARQLEAIQTGVGDVGRAAVRLASLPLEVVRLAARRLRLVHG